MIKPRLAPPLHPSPPNFADPHVRMTIALEAERQIQIFKNGVGTSKRFMIRNIGTMLRMGGARFEGKFGSYTVIFWDPWNQYYHELDEELNNNMLGLIGAFKSIGRDV